MTPVPKGLLLVWPGVSLCIATFFLVRAQFKEGFRRESDISGAVYCFLITIAILAGELLYSLYFP